MAGLDVGQASPQWERVERIVQRALWVVILGIPVLALLGILGGSGPAAAAEARLGDGGRVRHVRIAREGRGLVFEIEPVLPARSVSLSRSYVDAFEIEKILPEPATESFDGERFLLGFGAAGTRRVEMRLTPHRWGSVSGTIEVDGIATDIRTTVLP